MVQNLESASNMLPIGQFIDYKRGDGRYLLPGKVILIQASTMFSNDNYPQFRQSSLLVKGQAKDHCFHYNS